MTGLRTDESRLHLADVAGYLNGRGVLSGLDAVDVSVLSGGVSADGFAVQSGAVGVVVKQALGQLKVATTWQADRGRVIVEADALRLAGALLRAVWAEERDISDGPTLAAIASGAGLDPALLAAGLGQELAKGRVAGQVDGE